MTFLYLIFFSIIPSLAWLIIFLREDPDPEPKKMLVRTFLAGVLSTVPVLIIGLIADYMMKRFGVSLGTTLLLGAILVAPVTEELFKYLALRLFALKSSALDEPPDVMIYAITAALGFATMENIIFLFPGKGFFVQEMIVGSAIRFVSGTFLHALVSGIMGYLLILTLRKQKKFPWLGLSLAMLLHAFYNFSIIASEVSRSWSVVTPIMLILIFIILLSLFSRTRKMKSVCLLKK